MRLCSLASGSKGNCLYLETGGVQLLIDAGLSMRELTARMGSQGIDPASLDAILITHEHTDHIRGAGALARRHRIPVIISYATHRVTEHLFSQTETIPFESGYSFTFKDVLIDPFPVPHDCVDPVGFLIESREGKAATATDLGYVTRLVREKLRGTRVLNLESNHDPVLLREGPYPWALKQRISSKHGHLSNAETLELLLELAHDRLELLVMAHLSEVNNHPDKVDAMVTQFIAGQHCCRPQILVGNQYQPSPLVSV